MANQEHLDILRQGVATWNAWRAQHQDAAIDLSYDDLDSADLSYANLNTTVCASLELLQQALLTLTKEAATNEGGETTCGCD